MDSQSLSVCTLAVFFSLITVCFADDGLRPVYHRDLYICDPKRFPPINLNMSELVFCDKTLPYQVRAKDLVERMTLTEKVKQSGRQAAGVPRLGIPNYNWWSEALHGVSNVGGGTNFTKIIPAATSFPTVIHSAASFNKSLWNNIGKVVSTEARAIYNSQQGGLTFWSPTMNPVRDPRWGRITETPGEDPYVVGVYSVNFVRGMQDIEGHEHDDPASRPLKVSSCCKHYTAYDIDNWKGVSRFTFDAKVTEQDLVETFNLPFEMCVKDGDVSSVMCSYNQVNGIPTCADPVLLKQTIRDELKLNGYIVSDCDSIQTIVESQHWLNDTGEDAVAQVLKAGLDLDCGGYSPRFLESSIRKGKVSELKLDNALKNLYVLLMRVGYFDGSDPSIMALGKDDVCNKDHVELATQAAREGVVLLKNEDATLPFSNDTVKTLAVIGPNANATLAMLGNYNGIPCHYVSPVDGLSGFAQVNYQLGCNIACNDSKLFLPAVNAAEQADATVLVVGSDLSIEREGFDRQTLLLPGRQPDLVNQVASQSKGPVVLVVMSAGGYDISFAKNNPKIKGILWVGHPGMDGGRGIADVIFGQYNPGGRLPLTWYPADYVNKIPMTSMPLRPVNNLPGRTYKFYNGSTVYPFGYGLSYSNFSYKLSTPDRVPITIEQDRLQLCHNLDYVDKSFQRPCPSLFVKDLSCAEVIPFEVEVTNTGAMDGSEVVIVYSKPPEGIVGTHIKQVVGFERVFVPAKQSKTVKFELNACKALSIVDPTAYTVLPSGTHTILLGTSSQIIRLPVTFNS